MIQMEKFTKGWVDPQLFAQFEKSVKSGDCHEIASLVRAQGADRKPVDCYISAMRLPNEPSGSMPLLPNLLTDERKAELELLHLLAESRDMKLSELPSTLPLGMRELSWFLKYVDVPLYAKGKNFLTTEKSWKAIQSGKSVKSITTSGRMRKIETGRDAASYVHSDDPFELWGNVAAKLFELGVPQRLSSKINDHDGAGQDRFVCFGVPFLKGIIGHTILLSGPLSFKHKWGAMVPRPEQLSNMWTQKLLSVTYPEGSPMHPSRPAMHSFVALVCCYLLLELFDGLYELANGRTVQEELELLADNVGYFRVHAGVHYPSDHDDAKLLCQETAKSIVRRFLR